MVDYSRQAGRDYGPDSPARGGRSAHGDGTDSDTDFQARGAESDGEESAEEIGDDIPEQDLEPKPRNRSTILGSQFYPQDSGKQETPFRRYPANHVEAARSFKRAKLPLVHVPFDESIREGSPPQAGNRERSKDHWATLRAPCLACTARHPAGHCPLKEAGVEFCGLCGIAHYGTGTSRNCPHLSSVTQCRAMLETLKSSTESKETILAAKKYLVGVVGNLNRNRKKKLSESNALQPTSTAQPIGISSSDRRRSGGEVVSKGRHISPYATDGQLMNENMVPTPNKAVRHPLRD